MSTFPCLEGHFGRNVLDLWPKTVYFRVLPEMSEMRHFRVLPKCQKCVILGVQGRSLFPKEAWWATPLTSTRLLGDVQWVGTVVGGYPVYGYGEVGRSVVGTVVRVRVLHHPLYYTADTVVRVRAMVFDCFRWFSDLFWRKDPCFNVVFSQNHEKTPLFHDFPIEFHDFPGTNPFSPSGLFDKNYWNFMKITENTTFRSVRFFGDILNIFRDFSDFPGF